MNANNRPFAFPSESHEGRHIFKGVCAGLVGGLVASWTMNEFQSMWTRAQHGFEKRHGAQSLQRGHPSNAPKQISVNPDEDATERVADFAAKSLSDRSLSKDEKRKFGTAVHYGFGMSAGAVYGGAVEHYSSSKTVNGLLFGGLIWLLVDEGMIPLLGFSKSPQEYPLSTHAYALSSHLVYGVTLEIVRRCIRQCSFSM